MLQQTGAKQVEKKLPEFLRTFPTAKALAAASPAEVIRAWQGLGYNRRALNLHKTAKALAASPRFPRTLEALLALPGIGRYTASAILSFAFNADVPVVDVNIERVLSRLWLQMSDQHAALPIQDVYEIDAIVLPSGRSSAWHEALMDLGSTICVKNRPKCPECPVRRSCPSNALGSMPTVKKKKASESRYFGAERRIWRGRVLQIITQQGPIHVREIAKQLKIKHDISDAGFPKFVKELTRMLTNEHFITSSGNGQLQLAD